MKKVIIIGAIIGLIIGLSIGAFLFSQKEESWVGGSTFPVEYKKIQNEELTLGFDYFDITDCKKDLLENHPEAKIIECSIYRISHTWDEEDSISVTCTCDWK